VRQQYLDFLGASPMNPALTSGAIRSFPATATRLRRRKEKRRQRGVLLLDRIPADWLPCLRMYQAVFGDMRGAAGTNQLGEFKPDSPRSERVIVNQSGWEGLLETNSKPLPRVCERNRFTTLYAAQTTHSSSTRSTRMPALCCRSPREITGKRSLERKTRAQVLRSIARTVAGFSVNISQGLC